MSHSVRVDGGGDTDEKRQWTRETGDFRLLHLHSVGIYKLATMSFMWRVQILAPAATAAVTPKTFDSFQ